MLPLSCALNLPRITSVRKTFFAFPGRNGQRVATDWYKVLATLTGSLHEEKWDHEYIVLLQRMSVSHFTPYGVRTMEAPFPDSASVGSAALFSVACENGKSLCKTVGC